MPTVATKGAASDKSNDKTEGERASKWARKKENMTCYRCGGQGHFVAEYTVELCDICRKPKHETGECPLLQKPKPVVIIYGACCPELMFFESPRAVTQVPENTRTGVVKVTRGTLTAEQIVQRLRELVSASFR